METMTRIDLSSGYYNGEILNTFSVTTTGAIINTKDLEGRRHTYAIPSPVEVVETVKGGDFDTF